MLPAEEARLGRGHPHLPFLAGGVGGPGPFPGGGVGGGLEEDFRPQGVQSGEVPLADLIARFEQGTKLQQVCETRLKEAELRIEQLKKSKDGSVALEKFEADREG